MVITEVAAVEAQNKSNLRLVLNEVVNVDLRVLLKEVAVEKSVVENKKEREWPWARPWRRSNTIQESSWRKWPWTRSMAASLHGIDCNKQHTQQYQHQKHQQ